jgi:hypothetical protein
MARADVLFNSISTNGSSSDLAQTPGWNVLSFGDSLNVGVGIAASFTLPAGNYSLTSVSLGFGYLEDTNNLAFSLQADSGGHPTGIPLETIVSHPTDITSLYQVVTYTSSLSPVMAGGVKYWLVAEPVDLNVVDQQNNSAYVWYMSGMFGDAGGRAFDFVAGTWGNWDIHSGRLLPAFRIEGLAIPEPSAPSLVFLAMLLCGWRRFNR